jgi:hypothetical protein
MQKSKDSFFAALQSRLATVNPERTVDIDGQIRPGILVCENEGAGADEKFSDVFCLEWGVPRPFCAEVKSAPVAMTCTIRYGTSGSAELGTVDRGRLLAAMDEELDAILAGGSAPKKDFACEPEAELASSVFWGGHCFAAVEQTADSVRRSVSVEVLCYPEVGE